MPDNPWQLSLHLRRFATVAALGLPMCTVHAEITYNGAARHYDESNVGERAYGQAPSRDHGRLGHDSHGYSDYALDRRFNNYDDARREHGRRPDQTPSFNRRPSTYAGSSPPRTEHNVASTARPRYQNRDDQGVARGLNSRLLQGRSEHTYGRSNASSGQDYRGRRDNSGDRYTREPNYNNYHQYSAPAYFNHPSLQSGRSVPAPLHGYHERR